MSGTFYSKNYPNEKMENLPEWKAFRKMVNSNLGPIFNINYYTLWKFYHKLLYTVENDI